MDQLDLIRKARELFGKYKYVILIVAVGIFLMVLPTGQTKTEEQPERSAGITEETDTAKELESILSQIQGVGKVRVMLSEAAAAETVYQTDVDEDRSEESTSSRTKTVVVSDGSSDKGLIRTVTPPVYLGAVVVCQGGDSPAVRLAVAQAVASVTGISTDRISVLKMK